MARARRPFQFSPSQYHEGVMDTEPPRLRFQGGDVRAWQRKLRARLRQLLAFTKPKRIPLRVRTLWKRRHPLGSIEKIVFCSEPRADVPAYVCRPRNAAPPYAWFICLQGHSSGMHNSIGVALEDETTPIAVPGDRDFALGCLRRGLAALCLEQRSFGERAERALPRAGNNKCHHAAFSALMVGRTLMGERVTDISRALDYLQTRPDVDRARLGVMGNSGGGTASIYSAALLPRLRFALPSCSFCTYRGSWMAIHHCACSYVPGILKWAEYSDVLGLLAPRPLLLVAGRDDSLAPIAAVRRAFRETKRIYRAFGAEKNCQLVVGPEGHRFYAELAWPKMLKMLARTTRRGVRL